MAKARVEFKQHLAAYLIINTMLVAIWFLSGGWEHRHWGGFWPIWTLLFWGVGLAFHAANAYGSPGTQIAREKEKLRQKYN